MYYNSDVNMNEKYLFIFQILFFILPARCEPKFMSPLRLIFEKFIKLIGMVFFEYEQAQFRLSKYVRTRRKFAVSCELSGNAQEWAN